MAFFVDASSGEPASVTGAYTRRAPPPDSLAFGWSTDGRAIVIAPDHPGCGLTEDPGVFLVSPDGRRERIAPAPEAGGPELQRSLRPRSVREIKGELAG
jgi:hypothetical protein